MFAAIGLVIKGVDALSESTTRATDNLLNLFGASKALGVGGDQGGAAKFAEGAAARAAKDAKAAAAAQLKATKAQTKAQQDQAKLSKAKTLFDIDQIQIIAALQGRVTEDEKLRLSLQLALIQGNATEADRLSNLLAISQLKTTDLARTIANLPPALNPLKDYPSYVNSAITDIQKIQKELDKLKAPELTVKVKTVFESAGGVGGGGFIPPQPAAGASTLGIADLGLGGDQGINRTSSAAAAAQAAETFREDARAAAAAAQALSDIAAQAAETARENRRASAGNTYIINGATQSLLNELRSGLVDSSASGSFSSIGRVRDYN
jgi:hypothetical protein